MLRIGLTGGLASGKSTVARHSAERGAVVFDADALVRDLYHPGGAAAGRHGISSATRSSTPAARWTVRALPRSSLGPGQAPRPRGAHPPPRPGGARTPVRQAAWAGAKVVVCEASLLLEAGTESEYDRVLLVVAPLEERIRRWVAKGGRRRGRAPAHRGPDPARGGGQARPRDHRQRRFPGGPRPPGRGDLAALAPLAGTNPPRFS